MKYEEQLITLQNCFVSYPCPSYELVHIIDPNPYRFRTSQPSTPPPTDSTTTTAASAHSRQLKVCSISYHQSAQQNKDATKLYLCRYYYPLTAWSNRAGALSENILVGSEGIWQRL